MSVKIKDIEKFKEMWLNDLVTPQQIAEFFKVSRVHVHYKRTALGLPPKGTQGFAWADHMQALGEEAERKTLEFLEKKGGFCHIQLLSSKFHDAFTRLKREKRIFVVAFNLGRSPGDNRMRNKHGLIFKDPYIFKTYACNSRTAIVRLMSQALKKPATEQLQKTVTSFLRRYLTNAERFAVLWKLGIRKWERSQVKSSIQIDGIIKPIERHTPSTP